MICESPDCFEARGKLYGEHFANPYLQPSCADEGPNLASTAFVLSGANRWLIAFLPLDTEVAESLGILIAAQQRFGILI